MLFRTLVSPRRPVYSTTNTLHRQVINQDERSSNVMGRCQINTEYDRALHASIHVKRRNHCFIKSTGER